MKAWPAAALVVLLVACSSAPKRPETPPPEKRPGAYYKDDGPGTQPPPNLAAIPDAVPRVEPLNRFANKPYNALGKDYVPFTSVRSFSQRGLASWYGKRFHGQKTSSGERYDMYAMTAAHPLLPIPSYARVTNLANRKSVVVRINDRGPFHAGRIIDLSWAAAAKLGYAERGSAEVEVEAIVPGARAASAR
jgi:rare lipoprotein A